MAAGTFLGAVALFATGLLARSVASDDLHDLAATLRAVAIGFLPAIGLHLALGLPDGRLRTTPRRIETALGYVASAVLAVVLVDRKPAVSLTPIVIVVTACAVVGVVGYLLRCRHSRSAHEQARLQWVAWGAVVAAAISLVAFVLNALVDWPQPVSGVAAASTILLPLGLALGSSEQIAVRIDRMLVHTITLAGLVGIVAACYLLIVLGLGRAADGRRADAARPVDASRPRSPRCCGCPSASGSPTSRRSASTASGTHPTRCCERSGAGSPARCRSTSCSSNSRSR